MKPPVESGSPSRYTETGLANQLQQIRTAVNRVLQRTVSLTTAGTNATEVLFEDPDEVAHDSHAKVTLTLIASNADGSVYGSWEQTALFFRAATGNASLLGTVEDRHTPVVAGGLTLSLALDGNNVQVAVTDNNNVVTFNGWVEVRKA